MHRIRFGQTELFRPGAETQRTFRAPADAYLRRRFSTGEYVGGLQVNDVLRHMYDFYAEEFAKVIKTLSSHQLLEFVLHQYDETVAIEDQLKAGALDGDSQREWVHIGPIARRALKFIAEEVVLMPSDKPALGEEHLLEATEILWICAEEMVLLAGQSDYVFALFPDNVHLTIHPRDAPFYWTLDFASHVDDTLTRVAVDRASRKRFVPQPEFVFDTPTHNDHIGGTVADATGVDYTMALSILSAIIGSAVGDGTGFDLPFLNVEMVKSRVADALNVTPEAVGRVIRGFTVTKTELDQDPRELWKPKHEHRAFRRGFFDCPHTTGPHISFSKRMASECLAILAKSTVFGQLPANWRGAGHKEALSKLSNAAGRWFEKGVADNLKTMNILGVTGAAEGIGTGAERILIPPEIGELDFIGYSPTDLMLVLLECKMARDSTEPRLFRDDISHFVTSTKSYKVKFAKKIAWVVANAQRIVEALRSVHVRINSPPTRLGTAMVTFVPSIAAQLIAEFPCVSLTEFMLQYEAAGRWPYEVGVTTVNG